MKEGEVVEKEEEEEEKDKERERKIVGHSKARSTFSFLRFFVEVHDLSRLRQERRGEERRGGEGGPSHLQRGPTLLPHRKL